MKKLFLALMLLLAPTVVSAQIPTSISIKTVEVGDSTKLTISWPKAGNYTTYDLLTYSNPRLFELEQFRVVTGLSWTIMVPRSAMKDSLRFYASVRGSTTPRYGSITYRLPAPPPPVNTLTGIVLNPTTTVLLSGGTQQFITVGQWTNGSWNWVDSTALPGAKYTATGGTITPTGFYTAGTVAGNFIVISTDSSATKADTSTVTVTVPAPILQAVILTPSTVSINTGATQQFSVSGQWSDGSTTAPNVTYTATGGTITAAGLYTAGNTAGAYRVIVTQQGGLLADTSVVTLTAAPPPPPNAMYFNSSETNVNFLMADDFEDGSWYEKDCDQANSSGGLLQTDGWCGTIYANPITPTNAISPLGKGFLGSKYAATSGYHDGSIGGRNMADHGFVTTGLTEAYFRLYFQPQSDYNGGHEKMFDFTRGVGTGQMVALCYNYFGGETIRCIPYLHQDDGLQGQVNAWMGSNVASAVTITPTHWYYIEMHVKLNTPGTYNGVFEFWMNDCGVDGTGCTGTPTLRGRYTTVLYRSAAESNVTLDGIWIENWANAATVGTMYYDNVVASKAFIGFKP